MRLSRPSGIFLRGVEPLSEPGAASRSSCSILSICHSAGAFERAEQLLARAEQIVRIRQPRRGMGGAVQSIWWVLTSRARVLYLVDVGITTTVAAVVGRLLGKRVIVDTGDASYALARSLGERSFIGLALVGAGEKCALHSAHEVVVRGKMHAEHVPGRATHIPDLPPVGAGPQPANEIRQALELVDSFTVVFVGSLIFSPRRGVSSGWDLVEALSYTVPDVMALIVGDGSGLASLRTRAYELGVADRCRFVGRVPAGEVARYISAADAAVCTQTNDLVGRVRTSGKLPLYLACGCPVLASHVGEGTRMLGPLGWTVPYNGAMDRDYPRRLAEAIEVWRQDAAGAERRRAIALDLAQREFDVAEMRARLTHLLTVAERR